MSNDEIDAAMEDEMMENFRRWDARQAKQDFIHRMERKLNRKERTGRS